ATIPPGPVLPPSPVRDSAPPPRPVIAPRAPASATDRLITGGGIVREMPPATPTRQTIEEAQEARPPIHTLAQAIPAVTSDRDRPQASVLQHSRPVSRKARSHHRARR